MVTRENENIMVELGDRTVVNSPIEFKEKLTELAQKFVNRLPVGYQVTIARVGDLTFQLNVASQRGIVVQAFGIQWNPVTKFVSWAAVL